jgi:hypothetical protein
MVNAPPRIHQRHDEMPVSFKTTRRFFTATLYDATLGLSSMGNRKPQALLARFKATIM